MNQKSKRKSNKSEGCLEDETSGVSLGCLTLYGRGGGCKVGADTGEEFDLGCRRRSSVSNEGKGYTPICGNEEVTIDCFSYRKNNRSLLKSHEHQRTNMLNAHLPDDILEMCLVRLPLKSIMNARLVCKKWRNLTTTRRFMEMRRECSFQTPWLFLFSVIRDGFCNGEIHALDVSLNEWHTIDLPPLKGRFMFSVSTIQDDIYVIGGRSCLGRVDVVDRSSFKTHRGVTVFNPITKSSRRAASMKHARSSPILGVYQVGRDSSIMRNEAARSERHVYRSRVRGESDVYEDPHRLSVRRRRQSSSFDQNEQLRQRQETPHNKDGKQFIIIVVGGFGSWDEPLHSGEVYDPTSDKWTEIKIAPLDFGVAASSGVVCNGVFYVYSENDKLVGYDIDMGHWIRIQTTTPSPPRLHQYHPKLVSCKGRVFMLSVSWCEGDGEIGRRNKAIRKLWEIDMMNLSWRVVSVHPDAPMDSNALFVADGDVIFGVEAFKIFGQGLDFVTMFDVGGAGRGGLWSHVSRNRAEHDVDESSCMIKSMAVMRL